MAEATKHSEVIDVTQDTFEAEVMKSELPVVVDCYATWCPPCKILSPVLDELAGDYAGRIKVAKVDVDQSPEISEKYSVMSIPTVLYIRDGKVQFQSLGAMPKPVLAKKFDQLLASGSEEKK